MVSGRRWISKILWASAALFAAFGFAGAIAIASAFFYWRGQAIATCDLSQPANQANKRVRDSIIANEDPDFFDEHVHQRSVTTLGYVIGFARQRSVTSNIYSQAARICTKAGTQEFHTIQRVAFQIVVTAYLSSKDPDLSMTILLNGVDMGASPTTGRELRGVNAASMEYFARPASDLTWDQAEILATLVRDPAEHNQAVILKRKEHIVDVLKQYKRI